MIKHLQKVSALALVGFALLANTADAQNQYEPFAGAPGSLSGVTTNGWASHSGTGGQVQIVAGSLSYNSLPTSEGNKVEIKDADSEDVNLALTSPITSGTAYASFLMNVKDAQKLLANTTGGNYFVHFIGNTSNGFVARVSIRAGSAANTFNIGIVNNSGGTAAPEVIFGNNPQNYAVNQTYLVVFKYDIANNTSSVWVNPTLGSTETTATVSNNFGTSPAATSINNFAIRQSNGTDGGTGNIELDEIRIGTTWAAVTPVATTTGIADATKGMFSIYPNPSQDQNVRLVLPNHIGAQKVNLTVWSPEGKEVFKATGSQVQVQESLNNKLTTLPKGMFFVNVAAGKEIYQTKLLKN